MSCNTNNLLGKTIKNIKIINVSHEISDVFLNYEPGKIEIIFDDDSIIYGLVEINNWRMMEKNIRNKKYIGVKIEKIECKDNRWFNNLHDTYFLLNDDIKLLCSYLSI